MRQAVKGAKAPLSDILVRNVNPEKMVVDRQIAGQLGEGMKGLIQRSITGLRAPPNAPATKALKGSGNLSLRKTSHSFLWGFYHHIKSNLGTMEESSF